MYPIYKREMHAYLTSPTGYIFAAVLLAISGVIFSFTTVWMRTTDSSVYFNVMLFMFTVLIPILTMKLFSEERKTRTEQILLTSPVSIFGIVFAKFLAAFTLYTGTFAVSCLINFVSLRAVAGKVLNFPQITGNIVGIILVGASFIAIGVFMSSLTENQAIAAVTTFGVILAMLLVWLLPSFINSPAVREIIKWFSVIDRFTYFTHGIFSVTATLYFVSIAVIFLFLTVRVYEMRRWN